MKIFNRVIIYLFVAIAAVVAGSFSGYVTWKLYVWDPTADRLSFVDVNIKVDIKQAAVPLKATVYTALPTQTKKYLILSSGKLVRNDADIYKNRICSISQDFSGQLNDGDTIDVVSSVPLLSGLWIVHDRMDSTMKQSVDFLVAPGDLKYFKQGVYPIQIKKFKS